MTVIVCNKIKYNEEEKYTYVRIVKSPSENEKDFEWLGTVTNPKYESNYQVGTLVRWIGDPG